MCFFWLSFRVLQEDLQLSDSEESGDDQVSFRCFIPSAHRHPIKSSQLVALLWAPKANLSFPSPICFLNKTGCWTATFFTWSSKVHVCSQTASLEEGGELCFFVREVNGNGFLFLFYIQALVRNCLKLLFSFGFSFVGLYRKFKLEINNSGKMDFAFEAELYSPNCSPFAMSGSCRFYYFQRFFILMF